MIHAVRMPKPGQMTEECILVAWHKREGDPVRAGDILFEIETDKSTMDVEAFDDGTLLRRVVDEGAVVPVNAVCAYIGAPGDAVPDDARDAPARTDAPAPTDRLAISPRASRLAAGAGLHPRAIVGTGPDGRIVERDVRAAIAWREGGAATSVAVPVVPAPLAGRTDDAEEPRPLGRMRRVIAERLTLSATTIPQFSVTVAADVTGVLAFRAELAAAGTTLSVTDFVLGAAAQTLAEFPDVNSRTDGTQVWPRRRVHLGLAVALPAGLVVPVIRDADRLSLAELHERAATLARRAREGTLGVDEMTGSTFTVSNLGMLGVDEFRAIVNPGEAAILAVASALPTPVAIGGGLAVRTIMKLTLSADHRLIDGELAARFLNALRRRLEDAEAFRQELANG